MIFQAGDLSNFTDLDSISQKLSFDLPIHIEPKAYPISITLDNEMKTKTYILNITVLSVPYFDEQDWKQV